MVSLIVPVYNAEKYLRHCLESIVSQTYSDLEIIVIDDGSTDESGSICDEFAANDGRIRVIHQVNLGSAHARNKGLDVVKGDYVAFVDADDTIHPMMIQVMVEALEEHHADISMVGFRRVYLPNEVISCSPHASDISVVDGDFLMTEMFSDRFECMVVWNKLYRKDIIGNARFAGTAEDRAFNVCVYPAVKKCVYIKTPYYNYFQNPSGQTHSVDNNKEIAFLELYNIGLSRIPKENTQVRGRCLESMFKFMIDMRERNKNTELESMVREKIKDNYGLGIKEFRANTAIPCYRKAAVLAMYHFPFLSNLFSGGLLLRLRQARASFLNRNSIFPSWS